MTILARKNPTPTPTYRLGNEWNPIQLVENMLRWDPFTSFYPTEGSMASAAFMPHVDVVETQSSYVFTADLPGIREEHLDIAVTGNQLVISGQREATAPQEGERCHLHERTHGTFRRTFTLPDGTNPEQVTASLRDGVLTLTVEKRQEVQPRRIQLSAKAQATA